MSQHFVDKMYLDGLLLVLWRGRRPNRVAAKCRFGLEQELLQVATLLNNMR